VVELFKNKSYLPVIKGVGSWLKRVDVAVIHISVSIPIPSRVGIIKISPILVSAKAAVLKRAGKTEVARENCI
jgi:hypothetical protein